MIQWVALDSSASAHQPILALSANSGSSVSVWIIFSPILPPGIIFGMLDRCVTNLDNFRKQFGVHDWVMKGLSMSSRVCATGHIKDTLPLVEKSRASCPGGRFPPSSIHQVIMITGLN